MSGGKGPKGKSWPCLLGPRPTVSAGLHPDIQRSWLFALRRKDHSEAGRGWTHQFEVQVSLGPLSCETEASRTWPGGFQSPDMLPTEPEVTLSGH